MDKRWAEKFRRTNKNIGVEHHKIGIELKYLVDDAIYWINYENAIFFP